MALFASLNYFLKWVFLQCNEKGEIERMSTKFRQVCCTVLDNQLYESNVDYEGSYGVKKR